MMELMLSVVLGILIFVNANGTGPQPYQYADMSDSVAAAFYAVESGLWTIDKYAPSWLNCGCLLGGNRCKKVAHIPTAEQVPPSPPPPPAKNKQYQALATTAEKVVPQTWWRQGFSNDVFLLTHNDSDLPRKLFDASKLRGKKLKNMVQCVTRQQFIRKSSDFEGVVEVDAKLKGPLCTAMSDTTVGKFLTHWKTLGKQVGGELKAGSSGHLIWSPLVGAANAEELRKAIVPEVLDYFYSNYGGVWTGCFKLQNDAACRGSLAAASLHTAMHILYEISAEHKAFTESTFTSGYMLATLGRGLLHGDSGSTGEKPLTAWGVKNADFVGLQAAFLKLYTASFGATYSQQLDKYVPVAFPPTFEVHSKQKWRHLASQLEPVYTSLRNWMFTEASSLIDFGPYIPLVSFEEVRQEVVKNSRRRILVDVGANGFFASPKYLLDSYAAFLPFTHAIMIEPEPHFSATVPPAYTSRYNITFLPLYVEVATGSEVDMINLLPTLVTKEDFVVLKFDVDPNRYAHGPTMEWGFLFSVMQQPQIAELVDELYIELHFHFPSLYWQHYHSNWEALDAFRYLRSKGAIVHSWP